jgi:hypothetical protein
MVNVKKVATVALSSALADVEDGQPLSPTTSAKSEWLTRCSQMGCQAQTSYALSWEEDG